MCFDVLLLFQVTRNYIFLFGVTMFEDKMTEKEVAALWDITLAGLRARRRKGKDAPCYKIGRKTYYKSTDVKDFFESKRIQQK